MTYLVDRNASGSCRDIVIARPKLLRTHTVLLRFYTVDHNSISEQKPFLAIIG